MRDKQVALKENINGKDLKKCSLNSFQCPVQEDKETLRNLKSKFLKAFHLVKEDVEAPENLNSLQQHLFEMK